MTIAETTVSLSIPAEGISLEESEAQIGHWVKRAGQELVRRACEQMQAKSAEQGMAIGG
jgi:hypothetical protein